MAAAGDRPSSPAASRAAGAAWTGAWFWFVLLALVLLLGLLQWQLWFGTGGRLEVAELRQRVADQQAANEAMARRNAALAAEVRDLKQGSEAVEERARSELGMIREGEVFYHVVPRD